jgi:adenylate cyclase
MSAPWELHIFENRTPVFQTQFIGPVELGRQDVGEPEPYAFSAIASQPRLVIARLQEDRIPRKYVRLEPQPSGEVVIKNLSPRVPLRLQQGPLLKPSDEHTAAGPVVLLIEHRGVRVQQVTPPDTDLQSLPETTQAPFQSTSFAGRLSQLIPDAAGEVQKFIPWLQAALGVLQSAAGSTDFFERAARAVVDLVGLDSCGVILREKGAWRVQAFQASASERSGADWQPSRNILERILQDKRTFWELPNTQATGSLLGVKALVAAPILDRTGQVSGVLYGDRVAASAGFKLISALEAKLVEVLAGGVAAGLARVEQEQAAMRARVVHEQFFTPELSRQLLAKPELLEARDEQVTVLFCDLRGFSRITEQLGAQQTIEWTGHVLGALSECVLREQGVLVDYVGDELMAMWGAPDPQPDHARRAARAALAMLAQLPALNERWRSVLHEEIHLSIGISTGPACVGNIGSQIKFKYGPRGNTVNLASRVQGANKYWKTAILLTHQTHDQLAGSFASRRLGAVRVINISEPVTIFELVPADLPNQQELLTGYEYALTLFEKKEFRQTARILGKLLPEFPKDGPSLVLMTRAVQCLVEEPEKFDPVWELPGK